MIVNFTCRAFWCLGAVALFLQLQPLLGQQSILVTIKDRVPVEHLNAAGQLDNATMSTPGASFQFLRVEGSKVVLVDPTGGALRIDIVATNYVAPVVATLIPQPISVKPVSNGLHPVTAQTTPRPAAHTAGSADPKVNEINQALGFPLFTDVSLWTEDGNEVGKRIGWSKDSISSYRKYDLRPAIRLHMELEADDGTVSSTSDDKKETPASITSDALGKSLINYLGSHAYSSTLYLRNGKPDFISLIFANNGDMKFLAKDIDFSEDDATKLVKRDAQFLEKTLSGVFGDFSQSGFGCGAALRQPAERWDWNGTSFLLLNCPGRYAGVVICPVELADRHGLRPDRDSQDVKANLVNNVEKFDDGDVSLKNIPYVDQGPKGYCVPASFERYMRYLDIPSDMYFFATAGGTNFGGGTYCGQIRGALSDYLYSYAANCRMLQAPMQMSDISKEIDSGHPVMWACFYQKDIESNVRGRSALRTHDQWETYVQQLSLDIKKLPSYTIDRETGHMRLIVGYNKQTNEIATSDSFGNGTYYWRSLDEANSASEGDVSVIDIQ